MSECQPPAPPRSNAWGTGLKVLLGAPAFCYLASLAVALAFAAQDTSLAVRCEETVVDFAYDGRGSLQAACVVRTAQEGRDLYERCSIRVDDLAEGSEMAVYYPLPLDGVIGSREPVIAHAWPQDEGTLVLVEDGPAFVSGLAEAYLPLVPLKRGPLPATSAVPRAWPDPQPRVVLRARLPLRSGEVRFHVACGDHAEGLPPHLTGALAAAHQATMAKTASSYALAALLGALGLAMAFLVF